MHAPVCTHLYTLVVPSTIVLMEHHCRFNWRTFCAITECHHKWSFCVRLTIRHGWVQNDVCTNINLPWPYQPRRSINKVNQIDVLFSSSTQCTCLAVGSVLVSSLGLYCYPQACACIQTLQCIYSTYMDAWTRVCTRNTPVPIYCNKGRCIVIVNSEIIRHALLNNSTILQTTATTVRPSNHIWLLVWWESLSGWISGVWRGRACVCLRCSALMMVYWGIGVWSMAVLKSLKAYANCVCVVLATSTKCLGWALMPGKASLH